MEDFRNDRFFSKHKCLIKLQQAPSGQQASNAQSFRGGMIRRDRQQEHPHKEAFDYLSKRYGDVLSIFENELDENPLYKKTWQVATNKFNNKKTEYKNQEEIPILDECHIAIIAYTLDTTHKHRKLYADFNEKCRKLGNDDDNSWSKFNYKSLYWFLAHSFNGIRNDPSLTNISFRGEKRGYPSLQLNDPISMNHFTSSSTNLKVAQRYSRFSGTVIEFPENTAGIGISKHSKFPRQNEILILPWNTFSVKEIYRQGKKRIIVLKQATQEKFAIKAENSIKTNQSYFEDEDDY